MTSGTTTTFGAMTMTTPSTNGATAGDRKAAGAGKKLASIAAVVALAALLGVGAWGAYKMVVPAAPMAVGNDFRPDPAWGARFRVRPPAAPPAPVVVSPGQVITVRAPDLILNATGRPDGSWRLNFRGTPAPDAQAVELLRQRARVVDMKRPPADLKLTEAQRSALAAIPSTPPELTEASAARIVELCKQLVKLPAADAKAAPLRTELESIVVAAAKGDRQAVLRTYMERATQVRSILTPPQIQTLLTGAAPKPAAAKPPVPPATKPAA